MKAALSIHAKKQRKPHARPVQDHTGSGEFISDYMTKYPVTISPDQTLQEARLMMDETGYRHLPVVDAEGYLVGVLSDRDLVGAWQLNKAPVAKVSDAMTRNPYTVSRLTRLKEALKVMASNKLGCVLVRGPGAELEGIFTTTDALDLLIQAMDKTP